MTWLCNYQIRSRGKDNGSFYKKFISLFTKNYKKVNNLPDRINGDPKKIFRFSEFLCNIGELSREIGEQEMWLHTVEEKYDSMIP